MLKIRRGYEKEKFVFDNLGRVLVVDRHKLEKISGASASLSEVDLEHINHWNWFCPHTNPCELNKKC